MNIVHYLAQLPVILTLLAGMILTLVRWRKHPQVSLFALIGFGSLLLLSMVHTGVVTMLPHWPIEWGFAASEMAHSMAVLNLFYSLLAAIGWIILIAAVFSGRAQPSH